MVYISPVSNMLLELVTSLRRSTSYLKPFVKSKNFELAQQMIIEEKALTWEIV